MGDGNGFVHDVVLDVSFILALRTEGMMADDIMADNEYYCKDDSRTATVPDVTWIT